MARGDKDVPELVRAAEALENELLRLEALSRSVRKIRLNSERSIGRAAKELNEALALQDRLAEGLQALAAAMARMQARQQAALEPLASFAADIQRRMSQLSDHMQAFSVLGKAAGEVTALLQATHAGGSSVFEQVDAQLIKISEGARALFETAHSEDFPEVAREADALAQRVSALRKRLDGKKN